MDYRFSRTALLLGSDVLDLLHEKRVAVFGIGGVGSFACEALARGGICNFDLTDDDMVCLTNVNRQLLATTSTVGEHKAELMKNRILDINPRAQVNVNLTFVDKFNVEDFPWETYDYVIDAVDTVTAKIGIIMSAKKQNVPVISAMGAGNKLDASRFRVADIYETSVCPLARVMRYEMRKRGVKSLKVVYSDEKPLRPAEGENVSCLTDCICPPGQTRSCTVRRDIPGTVSYVPPVMGYLIAGEVIKDLCGPFWRGQ